MILIGIPPGTGIWMFYAFITFIVVMILFFASINYLIENSRIVKRSVPIVVIFYLLLIIIPGGFSIFSWNLVSESFEEVKYFLFLTGPDLMLVGLGATISIFVVFIYVMQRKKKELEIQE